MAETRNNAGREDGSSFTKVLNGLNGLKQSVDKSVRRTDDVLRKYNSAKMTDDGKERAAVLSKTQKTASASVTKKDVSEAVSTANESTAKRLNELFGEVKTASAKPVSVSTKTADVGKVAESAKKTPAKPDNKAAIAAAVTSAVAVGVASALSKKSKQNSAQKSNKQSKKTNTRERIEELFGEAKERSNASATRLDAMFGKANTTLTGVDKSINQIKKPLLKRLSMDFGTMILKMLMSPVGLLIISFVAGFIKGKIDKFIKDIKEFIPNKIKEFKETVKGWINDIKTSVKKFIDDPIGTVKGMILSVTDNVAKLIKDPIGTVKGWLEPIKNFFSGNVGKAILGGGFVALLMNRLSGGLIGFITKPLLGLLGKGIGGIITKGIPAILKGGLSTIKGVAGLMGTPAGAIITAAAAGVAAGVAINNLIAKREKKFQEDMEKMNESATKISNGEGDANEVKSTTLGERILGGDKQITITGDDGNQNNLTGHYDESGGFVVTGFMGEDGVKRSIENSYTIPKANLERLGAVEEDYSSMMTVASNGTTRVDFSQIPETVKNGFETYIDKTYSSELQDGISGHSIICGLTFLAKHFVGVSGEGVETTTREHWHGDNHMVSGLPREQIANSVKLIINNIGRYVKVSGVKFDDSISTFSRFWGTTVWSRYIAKRNEYDKVCSEILSKMIPESAKDWFQGILDKKFHIEERGISPFDTTNWFMAGFAVYQYWSDVFVGWMNTTYKTDFRLDTVTESEYSHSQSSERGIVSQSTVHVMKGLQDMRTEKALKTESGRVDARTRMLELRKKKAKNGGLEMTESELGELNDIESNYKKYASDRIDEDISKETNAEQLELLRQLKEEIVKSREAAEEASANSKDASDNSKRAERAGVASAVISANNAKKAKSSGYSANGRKVTPTQTR